MEEKGFQFVEDFKQELINFLDYYLNRRVKQKRKGFAVCKSQKTNPFDCLNLF